MRLPAPILVFTALGAAALAQGCAALGVAGAAGAGIVAVQDRTMGEGLDDALASNSVKSRLLAVDRAGFANVDVEVAVGRLLLSGSVPTARHRETAELIALSTGGVREVFNEIEIGAGDGVMRSAQDEMITAQIRTRLMASPNVRGVNVNIETHRGVVYLMGLARSDAELQRAAEIASVVPGVQRVVSLMSVRAQAPPIAQAQTYGAAQSGAGAAY